MKNRLRLTTLPIKIHPFYVTPMKRDAFIVEMHAVFIVHSWTFYHNINRVSVKRQGQNNVSVQQIQDRY